MRSFILMLAILLAAPLVARQELVTLPTRDSVQLTIYNSEDVTLVRERRTLSFREGANRLQFSWANTLIDPTSVEFTPVGEQANEALEVLDTSYPPQSHQMLVWTVTSTKAAAFEVEISYFTSGITWSAQYVGILNPAEDAMRLTAYVTVTNRSGEQYENASVRLVVGTINLVERIIDLASPPMPDPAAPSPPQRLRHEDLRDMERAMEDLAEESGSNGMVERREIEKESIGEYYIYTVEGRETIPNGWSKQLQSFEIEDVPVETVYRLEPRKHGPGFNKLFEFKNDKDHNLGKEPLPDGVIRLYRDAGQGRLSWVGQIATRYIPRGDEVQINAGGDSECTMKQRRMNFARRDLTFIGDRVVGWTEETTFEIEVRNFRGRNVRVEIHITYGNHAEFRSDAEFEIETADTQKIAFALGANESRKLTYSVIRNIGRNVR